jgi:hypothetical protein
LGVCDFLLAREETRHADGQTRHGTKIVQKPSWAREPFVVGQMRGGSGRCRSLPLSEQREP